MDRRRFVYSVAITCLAAAAPLAIAQQTPSADVIKPLKDGIYWTVGSGRVGEGGAGGNTGIIVAQSSVIVIDANKTQEYAKGMLSEIAKLTPKPVKTVILTHSDFDHVNGLAAFPKDVKVIAHENNRKEQEDALKPGAARNPARDYSPPPREYLPTQLVTKERESLTIDGVHLILIHVAPAHTSGDLAVYLPDQKIVFTGDVIISYRPEPLVHLEKNGSSEGWIRFAKALAALDADTFVAGHGELQTQADLQNKLRGVEQKRTKIQAMIAEGKSLDDIKKSLGETDAPIPGAPVFTTFTEVVYRELTTK